MRLVDFLLSLTATQCERVAWIHRDPRTRDSLHDTWGDIRQRTALAALFLRDHGVRPGDRIVNVGRNSLSWAILDLACSAINCCHVPIDPRVSPQQQRECIEQVAPVLTFRDDDRLLEKASELHLGSLLEIEGKARLDSVIADYCPTDLATILFTSGTSGMSRGVMLTHTNLIANALAKLDAMPQSESDHRLNFLPFAHAYARTCELTTWLLSRSSLEVSYGVEATLDQAALSAPTLINGVPVFYDRLCERWRDEIYSKQGLNAILGSNIRRLASGGAPIHSATRAKFASVGHPIFQGYGLTEASPVVCSNRDAVGSQPQQLEEVGPPVRGVRVRIDDEQRLWVAGEGVMLGYWGDIETTRKKLIDGWLDTGDQAEWINQQTSDDAPSSIRILGRMDDTIVLSSGYKIQPLRIEQLAASLDCVEQCLLVGNQRPYPIMLVRPALCLPENEAYRTDSIQQQLKLLLANETPYSRPRRIVVIEESWCYENQLANFKGAALRKAIERAYFERIEAAYQMSND